VSIRIDSLSKRLVASGLTGVATNNIPMICAWGKHSGSSHAGLTSWLAFNGSATVITSGNTYNCLQVTSTPAGQGATRSSTNAPVTTSLGGTWTDSQWKFVAFAWGPHDGSSHTLWRYNDGTETNLNSTATISHTLDFDEFCVGNQYGAAGTLFDGWIGEVSLWVPTNYTQAKSIADAMWNSGSSCRTANHATVTAIASPVHYWTMLSGLTATTGGVTLTNTGTASFGGAVPFISCGFM
jgi:hypothetical protein